MKERLRSLIEKLQILSERGEAGEAQVAKEKLEFILDKYNLSIEEIAEENHKQERVFTYRDKWDQKLLVQIVAYYLGREGARESMIRTDPSGLTITFLLSHELFIDVSQTLEVCREDFQKELDVMFIAFVQRHNLGISDDTSKQRSLDPDMMGKVLSMMGSMSTKGQPSKSSGQGGNKAGEIQWDPKQIE
jgi:hypothetical protein